MTEIRTFGFQRFTVTLCAPLLVGPCIKKNFSGRRHPHDARLGWSFESLAYHVGEGALYKGRPRAQPFGPLCDVGDKIGCGIRLGSTDHKFMTVSFGGEGNLPEFKSSKVVVFFTKNGKEIGTQVVTLPPGGFFPAVSLQVNSISSDQNPDNV